MPFDLKLRGENAAFWKMMRDIALPQGSETLLCGPSSYVFGEFRRFLIEKKAWKIFGRRLTAAQGRVLAAQGRRLLRMKGRERWLEMKEQVRDARRARYVQGAVCEIVFATPHTDSARATRDGLRACLAFLGDGGGRGMRDSLRALIRCRTVPEMQKLAAQGRWLAGASPTGPKGKFDENMRGFWEDFKGLRGEK